jgi:hypothetical protein
MRMQAFSLKDGLRLGVTHNLAGLSRLVTEPNHRANHCHTSFDFSAMSIFNSMTQTQTHSNIPPIPRLLQMHPEKANPRLRQKECRGQLPTVCLFVGKHVDHRVTQIAV